MCGSVVGLVGSVFMSKLTKFRIKDKTRKTQSSFMAYFLCQRTCVCTYNENHLMGLVFYSMFIKSVVSAHACGFVCVMVRAYGSTSSPIKLNNNIDVKPIESAQKRS